MPVSLKHFVKPNDPILSLVAKPILDQEFKDGSLKNVLDKLLIVAYGEQKDANKPLLVGLAAPQIGISTRIILVDVLADGKGRVGNLKIYVNPEIIWHSHQKSEWYEGCYSTAQVCGIVSRPDEVKITAKNDRGEDINETHSGYSARIFQHEIDHLNGKEFVTHISDDAKLHWVENEEFPQYRNQEGWRNWPHKCPRKKWEEIKGLS